MYYLADDGGALCPACANGQNGSEASETAEPGSGWRIVGADANWEDPELYCDHCHNRIPSAYAEPE